MRKKIPQKVEQNATEIKLRKQAIKENFEDQFI